MKVKATETAVSQLNAMGIDNLFVKEEGTDFFRFDADRYYQSLSPAGKRNHDRRHKVLQVQFWLSKHIRWMHWPFFHFMYTFWICLAEEGVYQTIKPRWGALTFSYLNDGNRPTVFHTLYTIFTSPHSKYSGLYVGKEGAPKSLAQAKEWDSKWEQERKEKELAKDRSL